MGLAWSDSCEKLRWNSYPLQGSSDLVPCPDYFSPSGREKCGLETRLAQTAQWRRNRSDFGRYTFFWPEMNIHNLCYKLLLASFPGSEAKLKRPLRCISLIRSYERTFPRKVHHKRIEILAVKCLGSPPTKVGRSLENDYKSVYSFPHKLNIVLDGSEGLRTKLEYYIPLNQVTSPYCCYMGS